ncbi:ZPR1 zinc finger domain-containing protein [Toxoplasma gondii GAB2-2007-GAL-DOM2]|uniref:ZPR1 zinc finger domain-containing protein n=11 Tax=Toxoplasma gondii TaxID=5811 RepID=A0A125YM21_TOXGV|nr:ZPR1 zinc finger domain-containing protein [Toxoplasma gondii GT1]ESS28357.1 ZPR1 zinc finger domain-containing protein [Toxoplasma gondii VEG]KAF4638157.1 ZPR1 zinc finger domain-containing protein [Toxoplasma gondii]KFG28698.1 ZPR1 zinc finger domain-containing protein [Toxoplasma gondii p89]KFG33013.1 ZPR1 zinc finger domain-containing protein [Toxoplasma gondii FOU]KFG47829.1 ZPR1 zinc finger domain-containing protein [Toxoplasma gondii GAB2-2007-GAL-DOM2]KFH05012.1 ZPR1 zinc finger do
MADVRATDSEKRETEAERQEEARLARTAEEDDLLQNLTEVESLCPNCEENGTTLLLLHKVPHFKEIVLISFSCPHCHYSNREVQSAACLAPQGVRLELTVQSAADLDRQIVRSEHATLIVKEVELEVPPKRDRGELTTVEGAIRRMIDALRAGQPVRRAEAPEVAEKIDEVILRLVKCIAGETLDKPWTLILDDPSGNSYIEALPEEKRASTGAKMPANANPEDFAAVEGGRERDFQLFVKHYERTKEQLHGMGFYEAQNEEKEGADIPAALREGSKPHVWDLSKPLPEGDASPAEGREGEEKEDYLFSLPVSCPHCGTEGSNNVCEIDVPGFRRCLIFSFLCQSCGGRHSEIKAAGAFGAVGRKWILTVETAEDLNRDVLKSDTAVVEIPSLDFSMRGGVQGGEFTTVEGLLGKLATALGDSAPFACGDSAPQEKREKLSELIGKLQKLERGENLPFTLVVDDSADMSFIGRRRSAVLKQAQRQAARSPEECEGSERQEESTETHYRDGEAREEVEKKEEEVDSSVLREAEEGAVLVVDSIDEQLKTERYKRTKEQEDDLGLTDMKV